MKTEAPTPLVKAGKNVRCSVCGSEQFTSREALLNTRALTFFNLDWANKKARLYVCSGCGNVLWFVED